jgi:hypothetical protein
MRKRQLKALGFKREPIQRWEIHNDQPVLVTLKKNERQIINPLGVRVGMHYPR